jgi:hypothetical protein
MSGNNRLYSGPSNPPIRPSRPHEFYRERKPWYDMSGVRPQPQSPGEIALRRRALGLSGPVRRAHAVVEVKLSVEPVPGAHDVQHIRDWVRHFIFRSFIVLPLGPVANVGRVNGRHGNLDWASALSADCECEHGRLKGDPCPQPVLERASGEGATSMRPPTRSWPFANPCWCFGEPGAITPEAAADGLAKLAATNARELAAWERKREQARGLKLKNMSIASKKGWRAR